LTFQGTDTYAAGRDSVAVENAGRTDVTIYVDRDGLAELDRAGRADKKGTGEIEIRPGDGLIFRPFMEADPSAVIDQKNEQAVSVHDALDELFQRVENREPSIPEVMAFDPALLQRFAKVKFDKDGRMADFYMADHVAPVLVKIGPTFTGLIMPIDREVNAANIGEDGLW
jgi:hypothetical protein